MIKLNEDKIKLHNEDEYEGLLVSLEANQGILNLLIAVCDDISYREEIINRYEQEISPNIHHYRVSLARGEPSLISALNERVNQIQENHPAVITVTGAERLQFLKLENPRSEQEIFLGYLQWTRESLTAFPYSIILWITQDLETEIINRSPDFWSWRKGVFRFISYPHKTLDVNELDVIKSDLNEEFYVESYEPLESWQELAKKIEEDKGDKDPSLIPVYNQIGKIYQTRLEKGKAENYQEEQEKAINYFLKVISLIEEKKLKKGVEYLISITKLGSLYETQGRYEEAEKLYQGALSLRKYLYGENDLEVATSLKDLAGLYHVLANYEKARGLYLQALGIQEKALSANDPDIANTLNHIGVTYHAEGNYQEAESLYKEALKRQEKILDTNLSDIANFTSNLALLYYEQGRYSEAESLFKEVLAFKKRLLGEQHPDIATALNNLGLVYYVQENYEQAELYLQQALSLRKHLLGNHHIDIAGSLNNLAKLYSVLLRHQEAKAYYQEALAICENTLGKEHPITLKIKEQLQA